ncbi:patatin-like phospholipase family protein [Minwuia thermotolerans]|uniref:Alpha/beta hydrolase n=1 Tax=Minwuia thermotolerans TaxID=2056226 RepID=A0A2M9G2H8_9PROT|nr:patatin-like phospholipase family protein [Minwuia thermotolerans]PJK29886.1 alpha/beta hydrolase [Minwuia thermotolerans]
MAERNGKPLINIALQGGGAHGAFTWGVLDRLFERDLVEVEGIVGTSAGAMNAAALAHGLAIGGPEGARATLRQFWKAISDAARSSPLQPSPIDRLFSPGNMDFSPLWATYDAISKVFSPYQLNPMNINPLKEVVESVVDFEAIRSAKDVKLFICATDCMNGRIHVFKGREITCEAVMASACLPFLFQAVEIDGRFYWDGGYMGNPPIYPLIYGTKSSDVLICQINPVVIEKLPTTAQEIIDRINTLSFNSSLMREMRIIDFVTSLIDKGHLDQEHYKRLLVHVVEAEAEMRDLSVSSKLNASWEFLMYLFDLGVRKADEWIDAHYDKLGREGSVDIKAKYL